MNENFDTLKREMNETIKNEISELKKLLKN